MKRVIPIFQALIESDPEGLHHRYRGQLGYALKDQPGAAWEQADAALTKAIELRGPPQKGWVLYEFNRALCRIAMSRRPAGVRGANDPLRQSILSDLTMAIKGGMKTNVLSDPTVREWAQDNSVEVDKLA